MTKSRHILPPKRFWLKWEEDFLRKCYANALTADLAAVLQTSTDRVLRKAYALGLKKSRECIARVASERSSKPDHGGRACQFKPGLVPWNKGKAGSTGLHENSKRHQFTKGNKPHTWVPVGSYRITKDGCVELKFSDTPGPYSMRWKNVAVIAWEAVHGPVPKGHIVVFKPGLKTTDPALITIDKLQCISRAENVLRNSLHRYPQDIVRVGILRGSLTRAINTKAKEAKAP
jgi:hypothetical protein